MVSYTSPDYGTRTFDRITKIGYRRGFRFEDNNGGTLITYLPVSPAEYRAEHPTRAAVVYVFKNGQHRFEMADDYGSRYELVIDDAPEVESVVSDALELARAENLLVPSAVPFASEAR